GRDPMLASGVKMRWLGALLLAVAGCTSTTPELKPPEQPEELTGPPAGDPRLSRPPSYPPATPTHTHPREKAAPRRTGSGAGRAAARAGRRAPRRAAAWAWAPIDRRLAGGRGWGTKPRLPWRGADSSSPRSVTTFLLQTLLP